MSKQVKFLVGALVFTGLLLGAVVLYNTLTKNAEPAVQEPASTASEEAPVPAPDFTVLDAEGNEVKLSSLFGKPIVLNFWASWCPPCKSEMPHFEAVYQELGDEVTFVMVDLVNSRETADAGKAYIAEHGYTFPVYFDKDQGAAATYGISSIPTTYFINSEGYIVAGANRALSEDNLRAGIKTATGE